jgi:hypothetical protein
MATYVKFNQFVADLCQGLHVMKTSGGNTYCLILTATTPNVADTIVDNSGAAAVIKSTSNVSELSTGGGYTANGTSIGTPTTASQTSGTFTFAANKVVFTATTGFGPFEFVTLFNNSTGTSATRPVVCWWSYGSALTLAAGETFTIKFNNSDPGTILTVA